ncbi:hypothetical protein [Streptomyces sp. NPDC048196]|uniref:hypothetical protein n=1 Tax=Streptomyces sp. NPDC048196 TaxID=3154712 RepID=UPI0033E2CF57
MRYIAANAAPNNAAPNNPIPHAVRRNRIPPATTSAASNNAPANGTHACSTPAAPARTARDVPGFSTTSTRSPFSGAAACAIDTRARGRPVPATGTYGPEHRSPAHADTVNTPRSRPLTSIAYFAVLHDVHTPATSNSNASSPINPVRATSTTP